MTLVVVFLWVWLAVNLRDRVVRPLQTLANLLSALREGDFSLRARQPGGADALAAGGPGDQRHRRDAARAAAGRGRGHRAPPPRHRRGRRGGLRLRRSGERLRLVNRAGERLLAEPRRAPAGRSRPRRSASPTSSTARPSRTVQPHLPRRPGALGDPAQHLPRAQACRTACW